MNLLSHYSIHLGLKWTTWKLCNTHADKLTLLWDIITSFGIDNYHLEVISATYTQGPFQTVLLNFSHQAWGRSPQVQGGHWGLRRNQAGQDSDCGEEHLAHEGGHWPGEERRVKKIFKNTCHIILLFYYLILVC